MVEVVSPTLEEFQKVARLESSFLISEFGFKEMLQDYTNRFQLSLRNQFCSLNIISRSFGFALDVTIKRIDYDDKKPFTGIFPLWAVLKLRDEQLYNKRYFHTSGQLKMLHMDAQALRDYCQDLLKGEFAIEEQVSSLLERTFQKAKEKGIGENARCEYSLATNAANIAFKKKDYAEVVRQLKSVENSLTQSQVKKLAIAEKKSPKSFLQKVANFLKSDPNE